MNASTSLRRFAALFAFLCLVFAPLTRAADTDTPLPAIIGIGFKLWAAKDVSYAFDAWKTGGLLENDNKSGRLASYFNRMDRTLGNFKGYDIVDSKRVSANSRTVYVAINFEHAAVFGRFLVYRADKDWVVQDMDFSPKPEAVMPWLAFAGQDYSQ